jgi:gliding motility-associated-like protein
LVTVNLIVVLKVTLITLLAVCNLIASAQLLISPKIASGENMDYVTNLVRDNDGNAYVSTSMEYAWQSGYNFFGQTISDNWNLPTIAKINSNGEVVWTIARGNIKTLSLGKDGILYAATQDYYYGNLIRIDAASGNIISEQSETGLGGAVADKNGNVYTYGRDFIAKVRQDGTHEWEVVFNSHLYTDELPVVDFDAEGNLIVAGGFMGGVAFNDFLIDFNSTYTSIYLTRITPAGAVLSLQHFGYNGGNVRVRGIAADPEGNTYMTGSFTGKVQFDSTKTITARGGSDFFFCKVNSQQKVEWLRNDGSFGEDTGHRILLTEKHAYVTGIFSGNFKLDNAQIGYIITTSGTVSRFEKNSGKANWIQAICTLGEYEDNRNGFSIATHSQNNLQIGGFFTGTLSASGEEIVSRRYDGFVANLVDTSFYKGGTIVKGKVFSAVNNNCDPTQTGIPNIMVKAMPGALYAMTDADGNFKLSLTPGTYTFTQFLPKRIGLLITPACTLPGPVTVTDPESPPADVHFGNTVTPYPYLDVDVATDRFRRCFTNQVVVKYTNQGLLAANNVKVTLELAEHLIMKSSSIPWSSAQGKNYTFNLGTVEPGASSYFTITDSVRCGDESIRGLTQCVKATITPENPVTPDPDWDRSDITLKSQCLDNGFLKLVILNSGMGTMADSAKFIVYADEFIALESKYKLAAGDSLTMQIPANGKTIRLEAYTTDHSARAMLSISAEGCGASNQVVISHGFVNSFSQSDEAAEVEMYCNAIMDSYDPNDKQVFPTGVTSAHNIAGDEEMEYVIRFQNTGTDVAYNIVIRDELTPYFDLSTLTIGASSHPCTTTVEGEGTPELVWSFKNIMLPDSTSNEAASHGFVKFKVKLMPNLPKGTVVRNKADIFFDFNSAVETNVVFNTIGIPNLPRTTLSVQNCSKDVVVDAGPDEDVLICDAETLTVGRTVSEGNGTWQTISGNGIISESPSQVNIHSLAAGENSFLYAVTYCQKSDTRTINVNRVITPSTPGVDDAYVYCSNKLDGSSITLSGNDIHWFRDAALTQEIETGLTYLPEKSEILFATDQLKGCQSSPAIIKIIVNVAPQAPAVAGAEGCLNSDIPLTTGSGNVVWYSGKQDVQPAYTGSLIFPAFKTPGEHELFAAVNENGCESERIAVSVLVKEFNSDNMFIPNVITPNNDDKNDSWELPDSNLENCAGKFQKVMVYNRFGKVVFTSNDVKFKWPGDVPSGVYFYTMFFDASKFEGSISVFKGSE